MVNIHQIRDQLVTDYSNRVNAEIIEPLTYIKTLAEPKGKILLIYKKVNQISSLSTVNLEKEEVSINGNTSQLDVTGTPLEDNCNITVISDWSVIKKYVKTNAWADEEEQYGSVNEDLATVIINEINVGLGSKCNNGSMFAICDASNGDHQFLLNAEYDKDWNWRGVGKFTGLVPFQQINPANLMKKHLSMLMNCNEASTRIELSFNVKSNQTIKCSWETASLTPSLKCNKNANIVVSQSIPVGDFSSCIAEYWRQLEILEGVKQDIEKYKKSQNNADLVYQRCASPLDLEKIEKYIMAALSNINTYDTAKETDTFDIVSIIGRMDSDRVQEVTDQLWSVLRFCSSFEHLVHALHYVFQCSAQSIVVNTPRNNNRLASLIRDISEKRNIPRLSGSEPLEILLEIGLQKVSKDYEYIFSESKVCPSAGFQGFIKETAERAPVNDRKTLHHAVETNRQTMLNKNKQMDIAKLNIAEFGYTRFDKYEIDRFLAKLAQVHLILEHIILMQVNLNLDHTVLRSIINSLPKGVTDFQRLGAVKNDRREFSIAPTALLSKVENLTPQTIKITMKSENRFRFVSDTFHYSVDPICPPNVFPYMQNSEEIVNKEILYCGLHYVKLGSRRK
ncbi:protein zwilch [Bradysia coprophila]|uniref:protein zwilch n=1 Tax=Bradysia coprophila TaxID=38358 RepID=UPI00187D7536|nr:protein zwilch [Bradysia coprophila]